MDKEYLLTERNAKKLDDDGLELRKQRIKTTRMLQKKFGKNVLRRGPDSSNWEGDTLLNLPPLIIILGILQLNPRELEILEKVTKEVNQAYVP